MRFQVTEQIEVNVPASKSWKVLAHEFDKIDRWSSGITESMPMLESPVLEGANVGGRVCISPGVGGNAYEQFTYYEENNMRFGYQAVGEIPFGLKNAGNNWHVKPLSEDRSLVKFTASIEVNMLMGLIMLPLFPFLKRYFGTRTLEELKYYLENDIPHPRKARSIGA